MSAAKHIVLLLAFCACLCGCGHTRTVSAPADHALILYFPWAGGGSIYSACVSSTSSLMRCVEQMGGLGNWRVGVLMSSDAETAHLINLRYVRGTCVRDTLHTFTHLTGADFTTARGMEQLFTQAMNQVEAGDYSLVVGCHGTGWLPAGANPTVALARRKAYGTAVGGDPAYQASVSALAEAVEHTFGRLRYLLFDDCYMQNIETAYDLRHCTDWIVASTSEVLMEGVPYGEIGQSLLGMDCAGMVSGFYDHYANSRTPYGTLSAVCTAYVDSMVCLMKQVNQLCTLPADSLPAVQPLDGFRPHTFYDLGSYLTRLTASEQQLHGQVSRLMELLVPYRCHTYYIYSQFNSSLTPVEEFSGITVSDPAQSAASEGKVHTAWWVATH